MRGEDERIVKDEEMDGWIGSMEKGQWARDGWNYK